MRSGPFTGPTRPPASVENLSRTCGMSGLTVAGSRSAPVTGPPTSAGWPRPGPPELIEVGAGAEARGSPDRLRYADTSCAATHAAPGKGYVVPNTITRRVFVAELAMISAPLILEAQERDKNKAKEEKRKEGEEKKDEAKEKAEDKVDDREKVVDAPGTDHAQDRRKDRRKDAVKKPPGA